MELKLKTDNKDTTEPEKGVEGSAQEFVQTKKPTMYDGKRAMQQMEKKRKKALLTRNWHICCWILEILDFLLLFLLIVKNAVEPAVCCFVVFLVIRLLKRGAAEESKKAYRSYVSLYTDEFVPVIVRSLFDSAYYNYEMGFSMHEVQQMQIVQMGNEFHSEDFLRAYYHDVFFRRADVLIEDLDDSRGYLGDQSRITLFDGTIYEFDFNKQFVCNMQVQDKNFLAPVKPLNGDRMERVKMESVDFNKKYKTFTTNAHDTFYILTPQIMEQILKLGEKCLSLSMNFVNQKLTIAMNTQKGAFEPSSLTRKLDYEKEKEKIRNEVMEIIEIVERLKLDNRLFL